MQARVIHRALALALVLIGSLARPAAATELPVSIFTSLLGAPFLIFLLVRGRERG